MQDDHLRHVRLSREEPIERLGLSVRPFNALKRAGVDTVGQLAQLVESGQVLSVRNIGMQSLEEIRGCWARVALTSGTETQQPGAPALSSVVAHADDEPPKILEAPAIQLKVIRWQVHLIEKQISVGLLHERARVAGSPIRHWLAVAETADRDQVYGVLATIIGSSANICDEIQYLFNRVVRDGSLVGRYVAALLSRYGPVPNTLEQTGKELDITRERVRQIGVKLKNKIGREIEILLEMKPIDGSAMRPALLRLQSALQIAQDMGPDITYEQWSHRIGQSGLVGSWTLQDYSALYPVALMIAVCNLSEANDILKLPDNLRCAVDLATSGSPDLPAAVLLARRALPKTVDKLIRRHAKHSGGVHARWLSQEIGTDLGKTKDILRFLRYREVAGDWFVSGISQYPFRVGGHDVFHHALRKLFAYCGPLSADEICSGLRTKVSRTAFPVPSAEIMKELLQIHGYKCEGGLYYGDGKLNEELSTSETIIMDCLDRIGPVVHHVELAQAFIDSELSFPALHATLSSSPLFERIGTGLYKLRGRIVDHQDIKRAEAAGEKERVRVNPEINYDKEGNITITATLGVIAWGTGTVLSEQFPNLSGEWKCHVDGKEVGELHATEAEFRGVRRAFELLHCQAGDRLRFTFNTWSRSVAVGRADDDKYCRNH